MTITRQPVLSQSRTNLALGALFLGAFVVGSARAGRGRHPEP